MTIDRPLFGDEPDARATTAATATSSIRDWQIGLLRKALDARGIASMADRQSLIEKLAGREVAALRDLTQDEALALLSKLGSDAPKVPTGSAWDSRDEDTWIDRL